MTNAFLRRGVVLLLAAAVDYGQGVTRPLTVQVEFRL